MVDYIFQFETIVMFIFRYVLKNLFSSNLLLCVANLGQTNQSYDEYLIDMSPLSQGKWHQPVSLTWKVFFISLFSVLSREFSSAIKIRYLLVFSNVKHVLRGVIFSYTLASSITSMVLKSVLSSLKTHFLCQGQEQVVNLQKI